MYALGQELDNSSLCNNDHCWLQGIYIIIIKVAC